MPMQKFVILISTIALFLGAGCLSEDEADEVDVFVQDVSVNNSTKSVELSVSIMYRDYDEIEDAKLVSYLHKKELSQWYATGKTDEIVIGTIDRGFNDMYSLKFSNLESGQYRVIVEIIDGDNETRGDMTSSDFFIP